MGLINAERTGYGLPPLAMGTNTAAQLHADTMLQNDYLGQWLPDGRKPYMVYTDMGGTSYVASRIAFVGWTDGDWRSSGCDRPRVICNVPTQENAVEELHLIIKGSTLRTLEGGNQSRGFLDTDHRAVNIGIARNKKRVIMVQHFEGGDAQAETPPTLTPDGVLTFSLSKQAPGVRVGGSIAVYYEPPPTPQTPQEIDARRGYCVGGGFTSRCGEPVVRILDPPGPGRFYSNLDPNQVVADSWVETEDSFSFTASLGSLTSRPGIYTVTVWRDNGGSRLTALLAQLTAIPVVAMVRATSAPTPTPHPDPDMRHLEEKRYMLELINEARAQAGASPVVLGGNVAAQLHTEASLENCFSSHWGADGLKPYMRYSLAGGYQSNGENGLGSDYCITETDLHGGLKPIEEEVEEAMEGWMESAGHRRNILDPWHKAVNIGLAWDGYNFVAVQHFEGDYVEYHQRPAFEGGVLLMSGVVKNGVVLGSDSDLGVQIYYDPPPHALERGQLARTYCYDSGVPAASLRPTLMGNSFYTEDDFPTTYSPCPNPYDVPPDAPAPWSPDEAHRLWQEAYDASQSRVEYSIRRPWVTASMWNVEPSSFKVSADLGELLAYYGDGVYTILLWGEIEGEDVPISQYSIFHGVTPPDTYNR